MWNENVKCEYCDQEMQEIETEEYRKELVCSCDSFKEEKELKQKLYLLEREIAITKQALTEVQSRSRFIKTVIELNGKYGKHIMC